MKRENINPVLPLGARYTYLSIDIETRGRTPGRHPMVSFAAVPFSGRTLAPIDEPGVFYVNLQPHLADEPATMRWWKKYPDELAATESRSSMIPAAAFARKFVAWAKTLGKNRKELVCAAWGAPFDWSFVQYYLTTYLDRGATLPFSRACLDIKSLAFGLTGKFGHHRPLERLVPTNLRPHHALFDAMYQGWVLMEILKQLRKE